MIPIYPVINSSGNRYIMTRPVIDQIVQRTSALRGTTVQYLGFIMIMVAFLQNEVIVILNSNFKNLNV